MGALQRHTKQMENKSMPTAEHHYMWLRFVIWSARGKKCAFRQKVLLNDKDAQEIKTTKLNSKFLEMYDIVVFPLAFLSLHNCS
jgi:hypothetical protein